MSDNASSGLGDLLGLFGNNNPISGMTRSIAQFQRGVNEFLSTIEHLNESLEQFNKMSSRVNSLLDLVEEPIKAFLPQVTRTVRAADDLVERLSGPIDAIAPGLARLSETLSNPALAALPKDLNEFLSGLRDLARRMQPLGQMAESAGSLFRSGPFGSLLGGMNRPEAPAVATPAPVIDVPAAPAVAAPRTAATSRKSTVRQPAKRTPATPTPAKRSATAKRAPAKRPGSAG